MNTLCGEPAIPLVPSPRSGDLYWRYLPTFKCSYAVWGVVMNDGRSETYVVISPARAVRCIGRMP